MYNFTPAELCPYSSGIKGACYKPEERLGMAKIFCDSKKCLRHKCVIDQTFVIVPKNRRFAFAFMYTAHCPVCGRHFTLISNFRFVKEGCDKAKRAFGCFAPVYRLFAGSDADRIFEDVFEKQKAVLFEVVKESANHKSGFYLNYSEYGTIKRCYSNLSSLMLGRMKSNFEDLEDRKRIFLYS